MTGPFGGPIEVLPGGVAESTSEAHEDMDLVRRALLGFNEGGTGFLRMYRPKPTAAFSPRDTTLERYAATADAMRELGFEAVERRAGGQLAVYDAASLVIDLVAPHAEPRNDVLERFRLFSGAIAKLLISLGIDARIGALDGEFCPGDYSVNGESRVKLAGIAQRIGRNGYHIGAVISLLPSDHARVAVRRAYDILGLPFNPATFGDVTSLLPLLPSTVVCGRLRDGLAEDLGALCGTRVGPSFKE